MEGWKELPLGWSQQLSHPIGLTVSYKSKSDEYLDTSQWEVQATQDGKTTLGPK
jgi:hypothetical protein